MGKSVRYENHYYEPGTEFTIPGLGLVVNFEDREVDEVAEQTFLSYGYEWPKDGVFVVKEHEPVQELVDEHTKAELVEMATDFNVPASATKTTLAEAIVFGTPENEGDAQ